MPDFVVSTAFVGTDKLSPMFDRMGKKVGRFGDRTKSSMGKAERATAGFGSVLKGVLAAGFIQRGIDTLGRGIREATTEFISLDDAITAAAAKFPEKIKRGTAEFKELGATAREIGKTTEFSAADAGRGLDFLAMAGFNAKNAMSLLPGITDLATVASTDLARATDIASDSLGAFGLMTDDTAQLTTNLARVNDVFSKATVSANVDLETLFETVKMSGPVAKTAGMSLETFTAIAGFMANAGIKGTKSGTAMNNMILNLTNQTPQMTKQLEKLGAGMVKFDNGGLDMVGTLELLAEKTKDLDQTQQIAALGIIFGKRAVAGATVSMSAGAGAIGKFEKALLDSKDASSEIAKEVRTGLGIQIKKLKGALTEIGFKFIDVFEKDGRGGIVRLTEAINAFDVKDFISKLSRIWEITKDVTTAVIGLTAAYVTFKGIVLAGEFIAAVKAVGLAYTFTAIKMGLLTKVTKVATGIQWLWNAALAANPLVLIAGAIALVVGGIIYMGIQIAKTDNIVTSFGDKMKLFFLEMAKLFEPLIRFFSDDLANSINKSMEELETKGRFEHMLKRQTEGVKNLKKEIQASSKAGDIGKELSLQKSLVKLQARRVASMKHLGKDTSVVVSNLERARQKLVQMQEISGFLNVAQSAFGGISGLESLIPNAAQLTPPNATKEDATQAAQANGKQGFEGNLTISTEKGLSSKFEDFANNSNIDVKELGLN